MENSVILCGNSHPELGEKIAEKLSIPICQRTCDKFSNTEIRLKIHANIRNKDVFIRECLLSVKYWGIFIICIIRIDP